MINKLVYLITFFSFFQLSAQTNIPSSGSTSLTTSGTYIYDMGGASGGITPNADGSITIYPAVAGTVVAVMVEELDIDWYNDYLYIYNGTNTSAPLLKTFQGGWGSSNYVDYREYYGTSGAITLRLKTHQYTSTSNAGCKIRVNCASTNQQNNMVRNQKRVINSCNTTIYDHGGLYGDYQNSSNDTILILPDAPNKVVQLTVQHFALTNYEGQDDIIWLGGMTASPTYTLFFNSGYSRPNDGALMTTRSSDGSASFVMRADATATAQGFRMLVTCANTTATSLAATIVPISGNASINSCNVNVSDNGDKYNYFPNSNGTLTINPSTAGKKVQLNFLQFDVASGDLLTVYDGTSTTATVLGTFTGNTLPTILTASTANSSGSLTVKFTSDGSNQAQGFVFNTSCVDPSIETDIPLTGSVNITSCNQKIYDNGGSTGDYADNSNGSVLITPASSGTQARLHFNTFSTEAVNDYLNVYDGNSASAQLIGTYSGNTIPEDIIASTTTGQLFLTFVSNGSISSTGFSITTSCATAETLVPLTGTTTLTSCNATIYDNGRSTGAYKHNSNGSFLLTPATSGNKVNLHFNSFSTEEVNDYLSVYDGSSSAAQLIGTYSGNTIPDDIAATNATGQLFLTFISNATVNGPGFSITTSCVPAENMIPTTGTNTLTICNTTLYDNGRSTGAYRNNSDGSLLLTPGTAGTKMYLHFNSFSTEALNDYLSVYDGNSASAPLIGTYSGTTIPSDIIAENASGQLFLTFTSNATVNGAGFSITTSCVTPQNKIPVTGNTTLTTCNANIYDDGGGTKDYSNNADGSFTIIPQTAGSSINLSFSAFSLENQDTLYVYNGANTTSPILAKLTGTNIPIPIRSTSGALTLRLKSNTTGAGLGFAATATCYNPTNGNNIPATGNIAFSTCSATIYDSGGQYSNYGNNQDGSITIYPGIDGNVIRATFTAFAVENGYDAVYVYNGTSTSAPLLGTYAGTGIPAAITANNPSGALTIRLRSDNSSNLAGVAINITCAEREKMVPATGNIALTTCSATIYDAGGSTGNYADNQDGSMTIYPATAGSMIRATFTAFNTESGYDYVYVYNGTSTSAPLLGTYAGTSIPPALTANNINGALTIRLKSDNGGTYAGFAVNLTCIIPDPETVVPVTGATSITTCGTNIYDAGGSFGNYSSNLDGTLTIYPATTGNMVKATFTSFSTENSKDILYVYNGTSSEATLIGTYSGTTYPASILANNSSGALTLRFTSDNATDGAGFAIAISCVVPTAETIIPATGVTLLTTCNSTIYDAGGSTGNYSSAQDGAITIYPATAGNKVMATFTSFTTESSYDIVYVYDGTSTSATLLASFSGTTIPAAVIASNSSGALTIRFKSDNSGNYEGFAIAISCLDPAQEARVPASGSTTITTCGTTLYDSGGPSGNYANAQDGFITIYPATTGNNVRAAFNSLNTEATYDVVYVYNGTSTSAPLFGSFSGTSIPAAITANNASGALTIRFKSDNTTFSSGFAIAISCITPVITNVTGVSLNTNNSSVSQGNTTQLTATIAPSNATNKNVTWTSSNPSAATVSASGLVTAVAVGTTTITVTTQDGNFTATANITVTSAAVTGITVTPSSALIIKGNTIQLAAGVIPANATNKNVSWTSSNQSIATVDATGLVTAKTAGNVTITATTQDGNRTATSSINIIPIRVTNITIDPASVSVQKGNTTQLTATITPANADDHQVTWASTDEAIATIDANGLVTAVNTGDVMITATSANGDVTTMSYVTVTPIAVTGITVTPASVSVQKGNNTQLTATIAPVNAANQNVTWASSNQSIATVSASGLVTAVATGNVIITATSADGNYTATSSITVTPVALSPISVTPVSSTIRKGQTIQLTASATPANVVITWSTSDPNIATVMTNGLVISHATGSVTITATASDGISPSVTASAQITVIPPAVSSIDITASNYIISVGNTSQVTVSITPMDADHQVTWTSSDPSIATVDANGLVTALTSGTVTITATAVDGNSTASADIVVTPTTSLSDVLNTNGEISIYPNPATDKVVIRNIDTDATVVVFDEKGIAIYTGKLTTGNELNTAPYSNGVYIIRVFNKGVYTNHKLVVIK